MRIIGEDQKINLDLNLYGKNFMKKMIIFGTIAIVVIICSSVAGIHVAKTYNAQLIAKYYSESQDNTAKNSTSNTMKTIQEVEDKNAVAQKNIKENIARNQKEDPKEQEEQKQYPEPKLPVYSEETKKRINDIYNSDGEEKIAYLTFDDGPSTKITPQILQILEKENIQATFFVLRK